MNEERRIENIPIHKIIPNLYQPRIKFDDKSIMELSNSIKTHGIIQPLILRKLGDSYEIIDGERRYKAAKKIGLQQVPSIILDVDAKVSAELALTENMQKQLLTPIEEANAYQQIMLLNKFDLDALSNKLGKEKNIIENKLKLLTLPSEIQAALLNNKIAEGHARALTKIPNKENQLNLFNRVLKERLPVKILEEIISRELKFQEELPQKDKGQSLENPNNDQSVVVTEPVKNKDTINLNDLSNQDFLKQTKENKMEDKTMNDTQLNFNQYNNLLKEQEKPIMEASAQPEPILGNNANETKTNSFFPSLEEQPLNLEVPFNEKTDIPTTVQVPQFDIPASREVNSEAVTSIQDPFASVIENPEMPEMPKSIELPQFGTSAPSAALSELANTKPQLSEIPTMEIPQINESLNSIELPQFGIPTSNVATPELTIPAQPPVTPTMEAPQINESLNPIELPQFGIPTSNVATPELTIPAQPTVTPTMEVPQMNESLNSIELPQFGIPTSSIITPEPVAQPAMTDVMPAVNMIRNLIPLLENSGYKIKIEESDNPIEYQIIIKVEK